MKPAMVLLAKGLYFATPAYLGIIQAVGTWNAI